MMQQFPTSFEFNEKFLLAVIDAVHSNVFGTFLCNSDKARYKLKVDKNTTSLWSYLLFQRLLFTNPLYRMEGETSFFLLHFVLFLTTFFQTNPKLKKNSLPLLHLLKWSFQKNMFSYQKFPSS